MNAPVFLVGSRWKVLLQAVPDSAERTLSFTVTHADGKEARIEVRTEGDASAGRPAGTLTFDARTGALREIREPSGVGGWAGLFDWPFAEPAASWKALGGDRFEARIVLERGGIRIETVQVWRAGEPWWDEMRRSEGTRTVLAALRIVPRDRDGAAPRQAVIDPSTGADRTGEFVAGWEEEYARERDRILAEARGSADRGADRAPVAADAAKRLEELQDRVRSALKNAPPAGLAGTFHRDMETARSLTRLPTRSLGVYTLEDAYLAERAMEGPVTVPPQVDGAFLESVKRWERTGDVAALLREFEALRREARRDPGRMEAGHPLLDPSTDGWFEPSESVKRLAEIGDAIGRLVSGLSSREALHKVVKGFLSLRSPPAELSYDRYVYRHFDLAGSGRYLRPDPPEKRRLDLAGELAGSARRLGVDPPSRQAGIRRFLSALLGDAQ